MNAVEPAGRGLRGWIERNLDAHWRARLPAGVETFSHPAAETELVATLELLTQLRADPETFVACILHAARQAGNAAHPAHGAAALDELIEGQQAAERVWSLHAARTATSGAEGLRRLLLAIIRDLRVVYILLARQLVRMRAADTLAPDRRRALAELTADIHAPLANRLGIWQLKWELEDLAFRHLQPESYQRIARLLDDSRGERERYIARASRALRAALARAGVQGRIAGRSKHIFSIWKKMQRKGGDFGALHDIRALRVLVDDVAACYAALGVVHALWPPVPSEFDDYIARPKGNNYQSLHTAVIGHDGKTLEVQIRTHDMHAHAEAGVAAHWRYKEGGGADAEFERKVAWMRQLLEAKDEAGDDAALLAGFRTDILEDRVYLLTPHGQVLDLPRGATVLDFAYHVHTDVGHRCRGAKVNGRIVPLGFVPVSGDRVEILTGKVAEPRRDWISAQHGYLATHRAREKVRAWFKRIDRDANLAAGRTLLERELKRLALADADIGFLPHKFNQRSMDDFLVALALGEPSAGQVARALHEVHGQAQPSAAAPLPAPAGRARRRDKDAIVIEGVGNLLTTLARCCQPLPGDAIVGYITRGRGVSIHRADCASFARLRARDASRAIDVEWGGARTQAYEVDVLVRGYDRKWLHKDVTNAIAAANVHLLAVNTRVDAGNGLATMNFAVRVADFEQLSTLLGQLASVPNVIEARRLA